MKLSVRCMLLSVSALSLPVMAQDQGAGFENFLLSSPSIVSPSQYYQVKGGRFEALAGVVSGTFESKNSSAESDFNAQLLGAGYAMALSPQLVLGADVQYISAKTDVTSGEVEQVATGIHPTVAFAITPLLSLGASINITSGSTEFPGGDESYSSNTFTVGGTLHQDLWEGTLAFTTANDDEDNFEASSPQTITLHGRYKIMPVLALGARFAQADYPGIEPAGAALETETSYAVILESAMSDNSRVEIAFESTANADGTDGDNATDIFLSGGFDLAPNFELGGQLSFSTGESDTTESSYNTYALTISMLN